MGGRLSDTKQLNAGQQIGCRAKANHRNRINQSFLIDGLPRATRKQVSGEREREKEREKDGVRRGLLRSVALSCLKILVTAALGHSVYLGAKLRIPLDRKCFSELGGDTLYIILYLVACEQSDDTRKQTADDECVGQTGRRVELHGDEYINQTVLCPLYSVKRVMTYRLITYPFDVVSPPPPSFKKRKEKKPFRKYSSSGNFTKILFLILYHHPRIYVHYVDIN